MAEKKVKQTDRQTNETKRLQPPTESGTIIRVIIRKRNCGRMTLTVDLMDHNQHAVFATGGISYNYN